MSRRDWIAGSVIISSRLVLFPKRANGGCIALCMHACLLATARAVGGF